LTKSNTPRKIKKPASLRSDGVRLQPGILFGFPSERRSPSPESAASIDDFCRFLERHLNRPLVNETNLAGNFDLQVAGEKPGSDDFIHRLHDQLGLIVTVLQRPVEMLIFRK
jgi:Protein of unknown function (DUF3738)